MMKSDVLAAYKLLGISPKASIIEITKAYRRLAKQYHPDSHPGEPAYAHRMMARLNEAYALIKKWLESPVFYESREVKQEPHFADETLRYNRSKLWDWIERYEKEKREREERILRMKEKRRREQEAAHQFWERLTKERQREQKDKDRYEILIKHTIHMMEIFFRNNFHNPALRDRPYVRVLFDTFVERYDLLLEKSEKLARTSETELYRRKSFYIYDFLKCFIFDEVQILPNSNELPASSFELYREVVQVSHRFLYGYFSRETKVTQIATELFKKSLDGYEHFLKSFPNSPLVDYVQGKIEVLEKFYRAFLR